MVQKSSVEISLCVNRRWTAQGSLPDIGGAIPLPVPAADLHAVTAQISRAERNEPRANPEKLSFEQRANRDKTKTSEVLKMAKHSDICNALKRRQKCDKTATDCGRSCHLVSSQHFQHPKRKYPAISAALKKVIRRFRRP